MSSEELTDITAPIYEVFFSYQGEGLYTGMPQIFVRFAGCNLKCNYCDTAYSIKVSKKAKYYTADELITKIVETACQWDGAIYRNGRSIPPFSLCSNPGCSPSRARGRRVLVIPRTAAPRHSVSITGGEPLLHIEFLKDFLPKLKRAGFSTYLETNGTLPENLKAVIKYCDIVSMDFKFASECGKSFWKEHKEFLKIALERGQKQKRGVFVKCVITNKTAPDEILQSVKTIKSVSKNIHLILQPSLGKNRPALQNLHLFYGMVSKHLPNVCLMAQLHKICKIR